MPMSTSISCISQTDSMSYVLRKLDSLNKIVDILEKVQGMLNVVMNTANLSTLGY